VASLTGSAKYRGEPDGWEFVSLMQNPPNWAEQYGVRLRGWLFIKETGNYIFTVAAVDEGQVRLSPDEDPAHAVTIANTAAQAQSQPQKLEAGKRYYIEALMKNETIDDNLTVSWQGPGIANQVVSADYVGATPFVSVRAYQADPAADAKDTRQSLVLTWKAGEKAKQHDVYFGADRDAVAKATTASAGIYQGRQALDVTTFDPGTLEWGKTYFWRVDEVNPNDAESPWIGQVWSFTTANFLIVDDFESYTDHAGEEIWSTWIDGFADNFQSSGSTVGIDPAVNGTFGETSIVHSGKQSLPLSYDNSKAPFFSEARLDFAPLADWTVNGLTNLTLYFYGTTSNGTERLYVAVEDSAGKRAVVTNPAALTVPSWTEWKIPLSSLTGVNPAKVKKLSIGVGDRQAPAQGGTGRVYIDDVRVTKS
jgi:hypothetical protein